MIADVNEREFEHRVIERSREVPVVVDFWAAWCGPCRALTPVLEAAIRERDGKIELAKVDTDANPMISQAFGIRGIPAVKAFKDGRIAGEFTGALPPAKVAEFLDGLLPSAAEQLVASGSEEDLRRALELEPANTGAAVALARLLHARGDTDEARGLLDSRPGFGAEGLLARMDLEAEHPEAFASIDAGEHEAGLDVLLTAVASAEPDRRDTYRRAVIGVLDELGVEHPLAREARRRLAAALY